MATDFRTVPRYFVTGALPATFGNVTAHIVDLSVRGARLHMTQPFPIGSTLSLNIEAASQRLAFQGTVSWCRMAALALDDFETDRYLLGVMFDCEQPAVMKVIDDLVAKEQAMLIEDARDSERYEIITQLTGSYGMHAPIRLLDLSIRGARIGTDRMVPPGTVGPLRFRIDRKHIDVNAEMVWCRASEKRGGFECGLRIEGEEPLLRQVIAHLCNQNQARVDLQSMRRKFDPLHGERQPGLLALV
ncbi:MAG TPA: PilZ domain-containing protein [Thermoanaerobaculia bacterium]|nr:PilZ domain-containing protein [Thermoanaerobaculia bacterium]